jgi:hypothetical protein
VTEAPAVVWRGAGALRQFLVPIAELAPFPGNPRLGDVDAVRSSLRRFGQTRAILVDAEDGRLIVAGHHVVLAATAEGWTHVAAIPNEFADAEEARAYLLADNRIGELGTYDLELLHEQLREARDADGRPGLEGTGYGEDHLPYLEREIEKMRRAAAAPAEFPPIDPDALAVEHRCPSCGYEWSGSPTPGAAPEAEPAPG